MECTCHKSAEVTGFYTEPDPECPVCHPRCPHCGQRVPQGFVPWWYPQWYPVWPVWPQPTTPLMPPPPVLIAPGAPLMPPPPVWTWRVVCVDAPGSHSVEPACVWQFCPGTDVGMIPTEGREGEWTALGDDPEDGD